MPFPIGLGSKTLTFGRYSSALGNNRGGTIKVGFDKAALHVPTGEVIAAGEDSVLVDPATGVASVTVPVTVTDDLVVDWDTASPTKNQRLKITVNLPGYPAGSRYVDISPTDPAVMDYDQLNPYAVPGGLPVMRAEVRSVAGLTGDVTAQELGTALGGIGGGGVEVPEGGWPADQLAPDVRAALAKGAASMTQLEVDERITTVGNATYVRSVNGTPVGPDGNVAVSGGSSAAGDIRTVIIGDSIDAAPQGWWTYYSVGSGAIKTIRNSGVGGETTTQMRARLQATALDYNPDVVVLGGTTNNWGQGFTEATTRGDLIAMISAIRDAGAVPILRTTPPSDISGGGDWNTVAKFRQAILRHNAWLRGYAATEGIDVLDLYQAVVDPVTGGFATGLTSDGVHPTETGNKAISDYLLQLPIPSVWRAGTFPFARAVTDDSNLITNGVFAIDADSNGTADSWFRGTSVGTWSLVPAEVGITGSWQRIETTAGTTGSIHQDLPTSKWSVGDRLQFVGRVRSSGTAAALVRASFTGATGGNFDAVASTTKVIDGVFYREQTIPAGTTAIRLLCSSTGEGWIELSEIAVRNLTRLGN